MYELFTDRARKAMQLANQEAQRFNHEYIGTEHILLGLVKEGYGVAANALKSMGIDLSKIRLEVEKLILSGPNMVSMGKLPQTPRAKIVIEYSLEEARNLGHNYVGTEHILLGLLREQGGVGAQVLMNLGLELEAVRTEILNILQRPEYQERIKGLPPAQEFYVSRATIPLAYKNFTQSALRILYLVNMAAQRFNHEYIGTEHLLLGFVREIHMSKGVALSVLKQFDVDLWKIRLEVGKLIHSGPDKVIRGNLQMTPRVKQVLEYAVEETSNLGHEYVGTEHILLGMLREQECVAAQILMNLGLRLDTVREKIREIIKPF